MESATEVRYAGVVLGRAIELREANAAGAFVVLPEPLPVGTSIVLKTGEAERAGRVTEVVESADPNAAGMRIQYESRAQVAAATSPAKVPEPVAPPAAAIAPAAAQAAAPRLAAAPPAATPVATPPATAGSTPTEAAAASATLPSEGDPSAGGGGRRRRRRR